MSNSETILCIIPSLVSQLLAAERDKGRPLTEGEVLAIRGGSECIAMDPQAHKVVVEERGYEDLDPEHCWEQWQVARVELGCEQRRRQRESVPGAGSSLQGLLR